MATSARRLGAKRATSTWAFALTPRLGLCAERSAIAAMITAGEYRIKAIRDMADPGDPAATALLPIASRLEQAATYVEAMPGDFWTP